MGGPSGLVVAVKKIILEQDTQYLARGNYLVNKLSLSLGLSEKLPAVFEASPRPISGRL